MILEPFDNIEAFIERFAVDEEARNLIKSPYANESRLIRGILERVEKLDVGSTAALEFAQNALAIWT